MTVAKKLSQKHWLRRVINEDDDGDDDDNDGGDDDGDHDDKDRDERDCSGDDGDDEDGDIFFLSTQQLAQLIYYARLQANEAKPQPRR